MGTGSFPGVKRPGLGVDHPPHLVPNLKKEYSCTSTPPLDLRGLLQAELYFTVVHWCTDNSQTYVESPSCRWNPNTAENKCDIGKTANEERKCHMVLYEATTLNLLNKRLTFKVRPWSVFAMVTIS